MSKKLRLTHAEEIELARILKDEEFGSRNYIRAHDKLVTHNMGLVNKIVGKFPLKNATCTFDDLIQEGVAGLIHGIRKFDPTKGCRLSTYVYNWISVYVRRFYQNHGRSVRIPIHMSDKSYNLNRQIEELTLKLGRTPTIVEIRQVNSKADHIQSSMSSVVSLNALVDENSELEGMVGVDNTEEFDTYHDAHALLSKVKPLISSRDYSIIFRRYGLNGDGPLSLTEVADEFGITRARVHQVESNVIKKMRLLATT